MVRHILPLLLAASLLLAACGDSESDSGAEEVATSTAPATVTTETASGCRKVEEPEPKDTKLEKPAEELDDAKTWTAVMQTSCGTVEIQLDVKENPKTASSFAHLAREGFYDGLSFHRVIRGFVAQGGDPLGTGQGDPGYQVVEAPPGDTKYEPGVVAMAKTSVDPPGTSGSQFFLMIGDEIPLEPIYAVAGKVTKGEELLELFNEVPTDPADDRPVDPVLIEKVTVKSS